MEQNNSIAHVPVVCRDHANELRRMARKVGHPAGDVPAVMHAAAAHIENLERRLREAEDLSATCRPVMEAHAGPTRLAEFERLAAAMQSTKGE